MLIAAPVPDWMAEGEKLNWLATRSESGGAETVRRPRPMRPLFPSSSSASSSELSAYTPTKYSPGGVLDGTGMGVGPELETLPTARKLSVRVPIRMSVAGSIVGSSER